MRTQSAVTTTYSTMEVERLKQMASDAMRLVAPSRITDFVTVVEYIITVNPKSAVNQPPATFDRMEEWLAMLAKKMAGLYVKRKLHIPETKLNKATVALLVDGLGVKRSQIPSIERGNQLVRCAENISGHILESFIASVAEPRGWTRCDSIIRHVDFIKRPANGEPWRMLQVKNSNTTENSSSMSVRKGTKVEKWFLNFSGKDKTNWEAFPDESVRPSLSDERYAEFRANYLSLQNMPPQA